MANDKNENVIFCGQVLKMFDVILPNRPVSFWEIAKGMCDAGYFLGVGLVPDAEGTGRAIVPKDSLPLLVITKGQKYEHVIIYKDRKTYDIKGKTYDYYLREKMVLGIYPIIKLGEKDNANVNIGK